MRGDRTLLIPGRWYRHIEFDYAQIARNISKYLSGSILISPLVIILLVAGCGQTGDEIRVVHSIDPDSVAVVENGSLPQEWNGHLPTLVLQDEWVIGDDPDNKETHFTGLGYIRTTEGPDQQIGHLSLFPLELRVFDQTGRFLWKAGRLGAGPGEFRIPNGVVYHEEIGWIVSERSRKIVFNEQGSYTHDFNLDGLPYSLYARGFHLGIEGRFWYMGDGYHLEGNINQNLYHLIAGILGDGTTTIHHTIEEPPFHQELDRIQIIEHWPTVMRIDSQDRAWVAGVLEYQIEVIPHAGVGRFRIRRDFDLINYNPRYREQFESNWQKYSSEPHMWPRLPEKQPAIINISCGPDGEMWVFMEAWVDSPYVQVDVFDEEGIYQRAFLADAALAGIPFADDHVYRFDTAESGAPLIIRSKYSIKP